MLELLGQRLQGSELPQEQEGLQQERELRPPHRHNRHRHRLPGPEWQQLALELQAPVPPGQPERYHSTQLAVSAQQQIVSNRLVQ